MNRPIRFRAWDGKIMQGDLLGRNFDLVCEALELEPYEFVRALAGSYDHIKIMQFTGLHDKNGKEIYEGDIIKDDEGIENIQVIYVDGSFWFSYSRFPEKVGENRFTYDWAKEHDEWKNMGIIGNIYQNPELLITVSNNLE